jgi:acyl transferase domain-containing protein/acyl carrier protein
VKRLELLIEHVRAEVAAVLGLDPAEAPDAGQGFFDIGMDSLMTVELRNRLERAVGCRLPTTLAFDYPSIRELARYLLDDVLGLETGGHVAASEERPVLARPAEPIAIIGMGCRFPGGAEGPEAFWELLHAGRDAIVEIPPERWDVDAYYDPVPGTPGKMYVRHGGFLSGVEQFDAPFFGISPREAVSMDPQQRLLLEVAWQALEDAGQPPPQLAGSATGVFVGITVNDYAQILFQSLNLADVDLYAGTGNPLNTTAGRVSYAMGLQGPAMAVDTACSSSLVAVHLACQSLRSGDSEVALAGGVNLILAPEGNVVWCQGELLSPDGRCKTFDASADGYVRGEGCGVVVLKRLSDAQAAGDRILAVIRGSAVNQDGASSGFTVPNGPAQQALIRRAWREAQVAPEEVSYVEAHGTGTSLGDPIEVGALGGVLGERPADAPVYVGSVKTNVGHLEAAAGIAALMKVVLSLAHEEIPPHLHFSEPNPHIAWDALPVRVPTEGVAWPRGERPRVAGVSSFGVSGTNAHVVLAEAPAVPEGVVVEEGVQRGSEVLVLSAKSEAALGALAGRYARFLQSANEVSVADVCYSASTGRASLSQRLAVVGGTCAALSGKLAAFAEGSVAAGVVHGDASRCIARRSMPATRCCAASSSGRCWR